MKKGGELIDCIEREGLTYKPGCAFFEFVNKTEDIHERKRVILMDKVSKFMNQKDVDTTLMQTEKWCETVYSHVISRLSLI